MRIFTASLATETNTFSPLPTTLEDFYASFYAPPFEHPETPTLCSAPITELRARMRDNQGLVVIEGTAAWAEPAGLVNRAAYDHLCAEILLQLQKAMPVDAVVLGLHGAMVAQGVDDCEGELLAKVRGIAGDKAIIAVEMDPHSHLTAKRLAACDIAVYFKEFPHTDFVERARDTVNLAIAAVRREIRPVISAYDCRMIDIFPTSIEPMRTFVNKLMLLEGKDGVLSISVVHGFMAADVPDVGAWIVVVTNDRKDFGDVLAKGLGQELFAMRGKTRQQFLSIDEALDAAINSDSTPVVIADVWDNPGGGVAGDGTLLLRRLIERRINSVAIASIWDPMAVRLCFAAGSDAALQLRFGGKTHANGGLPLDGLVTVESLHRNAHQSFGASKVPLGDCAVIRIDGIRVILNSVRSQAFEPTVFSNLGIDPTAQRILVVKSTNHFYAGFSRISDRILYMDAGGPYISDPKRIPYTKLKRKVWPIVDDPFTELS